MAAKFCTVALNTCGPWIWKFMSPAWRPTLWGGPIVLEFVQPSLKRFGARIRCHVIRKIYNDKRSSIFIQTGMRNPNIAVCRKQDADDGRHEGNANHSNDEQAPVQAKLHCNNKTVTTSQSYKIIEDSLHVTTVILQCS